jgi:hypothetical protein
MALYVKVEVSTTCALSRPVFGKKGYVGCKGRRDRDFQLSKSIWVDPILAEFGKTPTYCGPSIKP